jgi:hypothetical protein
VGVVADKKCSLCGDEGSPGVHAPVFDVNGRPAIRRVCEPCLSMLLSVSLQFLARAHDQLAGLVCAVQVTGTSSST